MFCTWCLPIHFYISDIPDNITSTVTLFVDDTIMHIYFKPKTNTVVLQKDLHKLGKWAKTWNMKFNLEVLCHSCNKKQNCY